MLASFKEKPLQWIQGSLLVGALVAGAGLYGFHEPTRREISTLIEILWSMDALRLRDYLLQFGYWRIVLISVGLMVLQAIIAPLPAFVITIANGLVFGWFWGGVICLLSATFAAQLCFEIARFLGRPLVEWLVGKPVLLTVDHFMNRYGLSAILIARLLPVVPFDPISYAAGLTAISRARFVISNLIGQLPATFIYAYFGERLRDGLPWHILLLLVLLAGVVLLATRWLVPRDRN